MAKQPKDEAAQAEQQQPKDDAAQATTVAMIRDQTIYPEPHSADVHPDEVENFRAGGWVEA